MKSEHVSELIGDTPLLKIPEEVHGVENWEIYAKLEYMNPFGSVKDRIAWRLIKDDLDEIRKEDKTILESSSGNTAKALTGLAGSHGLDFKTITNRINVEEVKDHLLIMGAEIEELPGKSECPDPRSPNDPLTYLDQLMEKEGDKYFRTGQYTDEKNVKAHYETTGKEITEDLEKVDYFFGGLGTTGSTRGAAKAIEDQQGSKVKTVGVVSESDDYIPGIRTKNEMWEVGLYEKEFYEKVEAVSSEDAVDATVELIRRAGITGGPTTGASLQAAKRVLSEKEDGGTAVLYACDRFEPYITYIQDRKPEIFGMKKQENLDVTREDVEAVPSITPEEVKETDGDHLNIIDTRPRKAFKASHIPGSINVQPDQLKNLSQIGFCRDSKIVVTCPVGIKSRKQAAYLRKQGLDAYNLEKGLRNWKNSGFELEHN